MMQPSHPLGGPPLGWEHAEFHVVEWLLVDLTHRRGGHGPQVVFHGGGHCQLDVDR